MNQLNKKSKDDEIKAVENLYVVDAILSGENACVNPYNLDSRLREEYKTSEKMENIAYKFSFNDRRPANRSVSEKEEIMNRLQSDKMGIIADVLLNHKIIKCVDELYVKPQMENMSMYMSATQYIANILVAEIDVLSCNFNVDLQSIR